jgi:hypothetical protein
MEDVIVYVMTDAKGRVTDVNSSAHLADAEGWTQIDRGVGLRYRHAQGYYFDPPILDERGICRYRLEGGKPVLRTAEEMDADVIPSAPTDEDRIAALEAQNAMLTECVLEMSALLYA